MSMIAVLKLLNASRFIGLSGGLCYIIICFPLGRMLLVDGEQELFDEFVNTLAEFLAAIAFLCRNGSKLCLIFIFCLEIQRQIPG